MRPIQPQKDPGAGPGTTSIGFSVEPPGTAQPRRRGRPRQGSPAGVSGLAACDGLAPPGPVPGGTARRRSLNSKENRQWPASTNSTKRSPTRSSPRWSRACCPGTAPGASIPTPASRSPLRENAVPYQGINVLILWGAAIDAGYASPFWMTYRQASSIGAQVRRSERATHIVFAKTAKKKERDDLGQEVEAIIPVRRVYAVFNADQIDGLPEKYVPEVPDVNPEERDAACEVWFDSLGIEIRYGGERAYYAPGPDRIQMPPFETFESTASFLSTLAHESTHASGHRDRLDRLRGRLDERARAREELVAELGSAFLCADLGIASSPPRRPRELHRVVAGVAQGRAAGGVRRRYPGAAGRRVPARTPRPKRRPHRRIRHGRGRIAFLLSPLRGPAPTGLRGGGNVQKLSAPIALSKGDWDQRTSRAFHEAATIGETTGSGERLTLSITSVRPACRSFGRVSVPDPPRLPSIPPSLVRAADRQGRRPRAVGRPGGCLAAAWTAGSSRGLSRSRNRQQTNQGGQHALHQPTVQPAHRSRRVRLRTAPVPASSA